MAFYAATATNPWLISVAQISGHAGESKHIDADFPAPSGIGDSIIGIPEGTPVHVEGSLDTIVDGFILTMRATAPLDAECTRCLTPLHREEVAQQSAFFPYQRSQSADRKRGAHRGQSEEPRNNNDEVEIIAGEDEADNVYSLSADGNFISIEAPLRDALVDALPLTMLCREDCRGLCSQCGENLNEHPEHHHEQLDSRFAMLADFKRRLEDVPGIQ